MLQENHEATNARLDEMLLALSTGVATGVS
jgi:hypothetical protein